MDWRFTGHDETTGRREVPGARTPLGTGAGHVPEIPRRRPTIMRTFAA
jgi:hypothetical protein